MPLSFNLSLKVDCQGSRGTSDGGLMVVREPDQRLGLGELIENNVSDSRRGKTTRFPPAELFRRVGFIVTNSGTRGWG